MRLLLDIGNTSITCAKVQNRRFTSLGSHLIDTIPKKIDFWTKSGVKNQIEVIISSVVPEKTRFMTEQLNRKRAKIWIAGQNLPVPIRHQYRDISKLGMDRRVCVYGALKMHKPPFMILDYGTALTADYVNAQGVFLGGMIIPGPELAYQALLAKAALLPKNTRLPRKTPAFLGRTPAECLETGILQGYGAMARGLVDSFKRKYGKSLQVIATGGFAKQLSPLAGCFDVVDSNLCLKSLHHLFEDQICL